MPSEEVTVVEDTHLEVTMPFDIEIDPKLSPAGAGALLYCRLGCGGCHEIAATPGMIVKRLDGLGQRHTVESIVSLLGSPPAPMPDYGLDEEKRRMLAVHLLQVWPQCTGRAFSLPDP